MKLYLIIALMTACLWGYAQYEFAPIGAQWHYNKQHSYNPPEAGYIKITSIKDSIINNKDVRVLEIIYAPDDSTLIVEGYEYIHQSGDTIWYWKDKQFHVLYNFAMQKGDSILLYSEMENYCGENPYGWNIVDSTFTRAFNDIELKAQYLKPINDSHWEFSNYVFEIIGALDYFFPQNAFCGIYDIIGFGPLRCYSDPVHGVLLTTMPDTKCDEIHIYTDPIVNVKSFKQNRSFTVFPNPVVQELSIVGLGIDINLHEYEFKISNQHGQVLKTFQTATPSINVSSLTNGIYFLTILKNEKIIVHEKFIKL